MTRKGIQHKLNIIFKIILLIVDIFFVFFICRELLVFHEAPDLVLNQQSSPSLPISTNSSQTLPSTTGPIQINSSDIPSGMKLTFDEEFNSFSRYVDKNGNVTCLPGGKGTWQTVYNFCSRTQPANHEEEVYTDPGFLAYLKNETQAESETDPDNPFSISNGILAIKAAPSSAQVLKAVGSWAKYTSGLITTQFSFSQTYGYFEIRAKLPKGKGLWPAFWLLPEDETWPPEVDAMEFFGGKGITGEGGVSLVHIASHTVNNIDSCGSWHDLGIDLTQDFHTYGVDIEKSGITYYFDGKPYATCHSNPELNKPFYMLINLAVGGWPGSPDASTPWPSYFYIDYVRAYQKIE